MCLYIVTDMSDALNIVTGDNSDAVIDLDEKNFLNGLIDYDNESLYIPIAPTLSEESAIPVIADDTVDYIPINSPQSDRSHGCAHGAAART